MLRQPRLWSIEDRQLVMEEQEIGACNGMATVGKFTCSMWFRRMRITVTIMDFVMWPRFLRNAARRSDEIIVVKSGLYRGFYYYLYSCMLFSNSTSLRAGAVA